MVYNTYLSIHVQFNVIIMIGCNFQRVWIHFYVIRGMVKPDAWHNVEEKSAKIITVISFMACAILEL